jgi:hypothetical protein
MARSILVLAMAIAGASLGIGQVHALVAAQAAPAPQVADNTAEVEALAAAIRNAAATARASAAPDATPEARRQEIGNVVQEIIVTAGASPTTVMSAILAVRNCGTGASSSASSTALRPGMISVACPGGSVASLDEDTLAALNSLETVVLALLEGEQPAALGGGFFGGLNIPPSAGLFSGGTDYIG